MCEVGYRYAWNAGVEKLTFVGILNTKKLCTPAPWLERMTFFVLQQNKNNNVTNDQCAAYFQDTSWSMEWHHHWYQYDRRKLLDPPHKCTYEAVRSTATCYKSKSSPRRFTWQWHDGSCQCIQNIWECGVNVTLFNDLIQIKCEWRCIWSVL